MSNKRRAWDYERMMAHHRSRLAGLLDGPKRNWKGAALHDYYIRKGWVTVIAYEGDTFESAEYTLTDAGRKFAQGGDEDA